MSDFNSSLPVRTENAGDIISKIADATIPSQQLAVDSSGNASVKVKNAAADPASVEIIVSGAAIDPRDTRALTSADEVTADQGAAAALAGAWPVLPTDGTNSQSYTASGEAKVTVTQPLPAGSNNIGAVDIKDSAGSSITLGQKLMAASLPVTMASDQADMGVKLHDAADNALTSQASGGQRALDVGINVGGVQVDPRAIRALTSTDVVTANIKDATGAAFSTANPLPVVLSTNLPGTIVNKYNTSVALAAAATANHDYTITALKTLNVKKLWASASGKIRMDVIASPDGTTFTNVVFTGFNSTANPNISIDLDMLSLQDVGTGAKMRIAITNDDKQAMDVYSTICGTEN